jgi:hypothetical protein
MVASDAPGRDQSLAPRTVNPRLVAEDDRSISFPRREG